MTRQTAADGGEASEERTAMRVLDIVLRPGLGLALAGAQFLGQRETLLSASPYMKGIGALTVAASVGLWVAASVHCSKAMRENGLATTGPYGVIRHPIYASVLLLTVGLGLLFFTWLHFLVLAVFAPLWWLACRSEEREMTAQFGEAYTSYQERTAMLIPGLL